MELQVNRLAEQILWEKLTYSALCGVNAAAQVIIWSCVFELKNRFKCVFCWQFSTYMTCSFQLISQFEQMVKKKASFSLPLPVCVYCFLFFYKYSKPFRLFIGNLSLSWLMSLQKHVFFLPHVSSPHHQTSSPAPVWSASVVFLRYGHGWEDQANENEDEQVQTGSGLWLQTGTRLPQGTNMCKYITNGHYTNVHIFLWQAGVSFKACNSSFSITNCVIWQN